MSELTSDIQRVISYNYHARFAQARISSTRSKHVVKGGGRCTGKGSSGSGEACSTLLQAQAQAKEIEIVNLFPEPLHSRTLVETLFADQMQSIGKPGEMHFIDDVRTIHGRELWSDSTSRCSSGDSHSQYRFSAGQVLAFLTQFVEEHGKTGEHGHEVAQKYGPSSKL